jgi:hypothetical protein
VPTSLIRDKGLYPSQLTGVDTCTPYSILRIPFRVGLKGIKTVAHVAQYGVLRRSADEDRSQTFSPYLVIRAGSP